MTCRFRQAIQDGARDGVNLLLLVNLADNGFRNSVNEDTHGILVHAQTP